MTQRLSSKIRYYWGAFYAYFLGVVFTAALGRLVSGCSGDDMAAAMSHVYNATLQYSCVAVGFTSTVITIIFSLRESRVMRRLQSVNKYALEHLKSLLTQVFVANWIALTLALARPLFELKVGRDYLISVLLAFALVDVISVLLTFRMVRVLLALFISQKPLAGESHE